MKDSDRRTIKEFLDNQQEESTVTIYDLVSRVIQQPEPGKTQAWHEHRRVLTEELENSMADSNLPENGDAVQILKDESPGLEIPAWSIWSWYGLLGLKREESCA